MYNVDTNSIPLAILTLAFKVLTNLLCISDEKLLIVYNDVLAFYNPLSKSL